MLSAKEKEDLLISFSNAFEIDLSSAVETIRRKFVYKTEGRSLSAEQRSYLLPFADVDGNKVVVPGAMQKLRRKSHMDFPNVPNVSHVSNAFKGSRKTELLRSQSMMSSSPYTKTTMMSTTEDVIREMATNM